MAVHIVNHLQPVADEKSQDSRNKLPLMFSCDLGNCFVY